MTWLCLLVQCLKAVIMVGTVLLLNATKIKCGLRTTDSINVKSLHAFWCSCVVRETEGVRGGEVK